MSVSDVTRAAFTSGVSAPTWARLVRSATDGAPYHGVLYGPEICATLVDLLSVYSSNPLLFFYIRISLGLELESDASFGVPPTFLPNISEPLVPLYVYVQAIVRAFGDFQPRIPIELAEPLCQLALRANQAFSGPLINPMISTPSPNHVLPPAGSPLTLVPPFVILFNSLSALLPPPMPPSPSELLLHVLSSLQPHHIAQLTNQETENIMNAIASSYSLPPPFDIVKQALARVQHLMRSQDLSQDIGVIEQFINAQAFSLLPSTADQPPMLMQPDRDRFVGTVPLLSLLLYGLVHHRASSFGAGNNPTAVSVVNVIYSTDTTSEQMVASYLALLQAAVGLVAQHPLPLSKVDFGHEQSEEADAIIWRSFVIGRFPSLLSPLPTDKEAVACFDTALGQLFEQSSHTLDSCNPQGPNTLAQSQGSNDSMEDDSSKPAPFQLELLRAFVAASLIEVPSAYRVWPSFSEQVSSVSLEALEVFRSLEDYVDDKLASTSLDDSLAFLSRARSDVSSHRIIANYFHERFAACSKGTDLELLSHACKLLCLDPLAMDLVSLYVPLSDLVESASDFLKLFDFDTIGDPQAALGLYGDIVLFLQLALARYQLSLPANSATYGEESNPESSWAPLLMTSRSFTLNELDQEERSLLTEWLKSIFSTTSDGIDDALLRSTDPSKLLRLSTTFFSQAILALSMELIGIDALNNGVEYFLSPLLSWTLVGIVHYLIGEAERQGLYSTLHFDTLYTIVTANSCPGTVLRLTSASILRLLSNVQYASAMDNSKVNEMRYAANAAIGSRDEPFSGSGFPYSLPPPSWTEACQSAVREVFTQASLGKVVTFDVDRFLNTLRPRELLNILWDTCLTSGVISSSDGYRTVAAYILSGLRTTLSPPLLPYFLNVFLPNLLSDLDRQESPAFNTAVDTLVTIVSSSIHLTCELEKAFVKVADGASLPSEVACRVMGRVWANALLDRLEAATGPASQLLGKRLNIVLADTFVS